MRILPVLLGLATIGFAGFWVLTSPRPISPALLSGDPERGEQVFDAAGCASCHGAKDDRLVLSGGMEFETEFGTFIAPNISPDPEHGIGGWTPEQFVNAVQRGISPDREHYYPAFPYTSYSKAEPQDIADLKAYMDMLPPSAVPSQPHRVGFPFNIRRGLGLWKLAYLRDGWVVEGELTPEEQRGRYLAEALGHCGECHTARGVAGGLDTGRWLQGEGRIPAINAAELDWSADEIAEYLTSGFTPDYDSAGGHMALVIQNISRLPEQDRAAIAAYVKRVP
ncbi:c-type cytochrome [Falsirhodobacter xinxiangensis]|uniref:c-type cytochrome n=1 Tax=Falsirhodobacter xinxiangensis TaxID=2530049 RepID=UPI0010AA8C10|nr:c-type cytochrome [Rhodobacter xinxiangensis]